MHKLPIALALATLSLSLPAFADQETKPCADIAKACLNAGFSHDEAAGKNIWKDCMHRVLKGKQIANVNIDADTAKACRTDKIAAMKAEIKDLQAK